MYFLTFRDSKHRQPVRSELMADKSLQRSGSWTHLHTYCYTNDKNLWFRTSFFRTPLRKLDVKWLFSFLRTCLILPVMYGKKDPVSLTGQKNRIVNLNLKRGCWTFFPPYKPSDPCERSHSRGSDGHSRESAVCSGWGHRQSAWGQGRWWGQQREKTTQG